MNSLEPFDPSGLLERVDQDKELMTDILKMFQEGHQKHLDALKQAASSGLSQALIDEAHSFKGEIITIGYGPSCQLITKIEGIAKSGKVEGVSALIEELIKSFEPVFNYIKANIK